MDMKMFMGRLRALCGDTSAWASLQAAKLREKGEAEKSQSVRWGNGPAVTPTHDPEKLEEQFRVASAALMGL